jgi:hypothetical protein
MCCNARGGPAAGGAFDVAANASVTGWHSQWFKPLKTKASTPCTLRYCIRLDQLGGRACLGVCHGVPAMLIQPRGELNRYKAVRPVYA